MNLEFNEKNNTFVRREEISINNAKDREEIKKQLKIELARIIRQVKDLKRRAEGIKEMLFVLEGTTKNPGPVQEK
jgi:outer membrane protein assembly factor BamA